MIRQRIRGVRAADHDEFGGERPQSLDLLDAGDSIIGIHRPQGGAVENPIQGSVGDGMQVFGLASGKVEVQRAQLLWRRERTILAVLRDDPVAHLGRLHDSDPLRNNRPGCCLVRRVKPTRPQARKPALGVGDHWVPPRDIRPTAGIDVEGEKPAHLPGSGLQVAVSADRNVGDVAFLAHPCLGSRPVGVHAKDGVETSVAFLGLQSCRRKSFPEHPTGGQRPRSEHSDADIVSHGDQPWIVTA